MERETPSANNEQERHVPEGYDSLPLGWWLESTLWTSEEQGKEYYAEHERRSGEFFNMLSDYFKKRGSDGYHTDDVIGGAIYRLRVGASKILTETEFPQRLENGEYGVVLGEDTSGRIPTIFLREIMKGICATSNIEPPATNFYAGLRGENHLSSRTINEAVEESYREMLKSYEGIPLLGENLFESAKEGVEEDGKRIEAKFQRYQKIREDWKERMGEYVENLKHMYLSGENERKRILLCTEAIASGSSIKNMMEVLEEHGCSFDILTFSDYETRKSKKSKKESFTDGGKHAYFSGGLDVETFDDNLRTNHWISGVYKRVGDIHARPSRGLSGGSEEVSSTIEELASEISNQEAIKLSREIAKFVGANVAQAYLDYKAGKFELLLPSDKAGV